MAAVAATSNPGPNLSRDTMRAINLKAVRPFNMSLTVLSSNFFFPMYRGFVHGQVDESCTADSRYLGDPVVSCSGHYVTLERCLNASPYPWLLLEVTTHAM